MARYRIRTSSRGGCANVREEPGGRAVSLMGDGAEFDGTKEGDWVSVSGGGYVLAALTEAVRKAPPKTQAKPKAARRPARGGGSAGR